MVSFINFITTASGFLSESGKDGKPTVLCRLVVHSEA